MGEQKLFDYFGVKNVATLLARRQLRYLGHLARMPEEQVQQRLLRSWRCIPGATRPGRPIPTLLSIFGTTKGTYAATITKHLTNKIKKEIFGAQSKTSWFVLRRTAITEITVSLHQAGVIW